MTQDDFIRHTEGTILFGMGPPTMRTGRQFCRLEKPGPEAGNHVADGRGDSCAEAFDAAVVAAKKAGWL